VRTDRWRLIAARGADGAPQFELFDYATDPAETRNHAAAHPDIVRDLQAQLARLPEIPVPATKASKKAKTTHGPFAAMKPPRVLTLLALLLAVAGLTAAARAASASSAKPNIVYILADDLGWTDLACQGSKYYATPHLDRLAAQGVRMLRYYNSQNCAPTRAVLMSGQYAPRTGIYTVNTLERGEPADRRMHVPANVNQLPLDKYILPQALKAAGYATGMFGKWHLGNAGDYHPSRRGFDEALVSDSKHFDFTTTPPVDYPVRTVFRRLRHRPRRGLHRPPPRQTLLPLRAAFRRAHADSGQGRLHRRVEKQPPQGTHWNPTYAAMIQSVDESVGRIMARLDELKLADNTVIIFSSDNGGLGGYHRTEAPSEKRRFHRQFPAPRRQGHALRRRHARPVHRPLARRRATSCSSSPTI
jgi:arylsulfatase A-like enzyme